MLLTTPPARRLRRCTGGYSDEAMDYAWQFGIVSCVWGVQLRRGAAAAPQPQGSRRMRTLFDVAGFAAALSALQ